MADTPRVTVPVEPTEAMINHAVGHIGGGSTFDTDDRREIAQSVYRAMLSAAPAPEGGAVDPLAGWTPHDGVWGEPPALAPETLVHVLRRNGSVGGPYRAGRIEWHHQNADSDPLFYRPSAALTTREEAPAEAGELASQIAILRKAANSPTPDEDAGLTPESALKSAQAWRTIASNVVEAFDRSQPQAREDAQPWDMVAPAYRFGRTIQPDDVDHLEAGSLLRFYSDDPWFDDNGDMPCVGQIVRFTGNVERERFPALSPHVEVAALDGRVYPGGGWQCHLFQFVSEPARPAPDALRLAMEALEAQEDQSKRGILFMTREEVDRVTTLRRQALAALQAEQKGGA